MQQTKGLTDEQGKAPVQETHAATYFHACHMHSRCMGYPKASVAKKLGASLTGFHAYATVFWISPTPAPSVVPVLCVCVHLCVCMRVYLNICVCMHVCNVYMYTQAYKCVLAFKWRGVPGMCIFPIRRTIFIHSFPCIHTMTNAHRSEEHTSELQSQPFIR